MTKQQIMQILSTVPKRELKSCISALGSRCVDVKRRSKRERGHGAESLTLFSVTDLIWWFVWMHLLIWPTLLNNNTAGMTNTIYAHTALSTWLNIIILYRDMTFPKLSGFILFFPKLSRLGNCCFKIPWLFQVFHDRMNPECDDYLNRTTI